MRPNGWIPWSARRRAILALLLCASCRRACHGWVVYPLAPPLRAQIGACLASDSATPSSPPSIATLDEEVTSTVLRPTESNRLPSLCRREQVAGFMTNVLVSAMVATSFPIQARAAPLWFPGVRERRQLELCLVNVQRVVYWAMLAAQRLTVPADEARALGTGALINNDRNETGSSPSSSAPPSDAALRSAYVEARLGAKAILTSRVEVGAPYFAYTLAGMQITGCLDDLESYKAKIYSTKVEFREALATLVEFDGMDSVLDASPRSSLTLSRYDDKKRELCVRVLRERIVPLGQQLLGQFPAEALAQARSYISSYYPNEVPPITSPT